jgi:hypothetical protein
LKQQYPDNSQLNKVLIFGLLLVFINSFIYAQDKSAIKSFRMQKVIITKYDENKKWGDSSKHYFYIAFNYDYEDSISIIVKGKNISNGRLKYAQPDTSSSTYPDNRVLFNLSKTYYPQYSKCHIIFWSSKKRVAFRLNRRFAFYVLDVSKDISVWHLNYLNTYPWPD